MKKIVKIAGKLLKYSLLLVFILIGGFFLINAFDEELNPEAKAFFTDDEPTAENNLLHFLLGFNAPSGTKDIVEFGKSLSGSYKGEDELKPMGIEESRSVSVMCWNGEETAKDIFHCPDEEKRKKELEDNSELLSRYYQIYQYKGYSSYVSMGKSFYDIGYGVDMVWIQQRIAVDIVLKLRQGKYDEAFDQWYKNISFWQETIENGKFTWVETSIFMVVYGVNQRILPTILKADPDIAKRHKDKLDQVLRPMGVKAWNIPSILKQEHKLFKYAIKQLKEGKSADIFGYKILEHSMFQYIEFLTPYFLKEKATYNQLYKEVDHIVELSKLSPKEFGLIERSNFPDFPRISAAFNEGVNLEFLKMTLDMTYNPVGKYLLYGHLVAVDLINAMHYGEARMNLIKLGTEIMYNDIPDDKIAEFIKNAPPKMQNPLTEEPFLWDDKEKRIYFLITPEIPDFFYNIYL